MIIPIVKIPYLCWAAVAISVAATPLAGQNTAEPFSWTGAIAAGQTLEIKGVNGEINAVQASGATARVEATRTGRRNDPDEVQIVVVEHAAGVTICAVYPPARGRVNECQPGRGGSIGASNNDVRVAFTVQVPATANFTARTTNGSVTASGLDMRVETFSTNGDVRVDGGATVLARTTNGDVSIRTSGTASASSTNGSIDADLSRLPNGDEPLSFTTTNGPITLTLPAVTNASLDASTTNGGIQSALPILVTGNVRQNRLTGTIGSGGREIELRTTNGRIRLERGS